MSDKRPPYETADLPMENVERRGYNAVPHEIIPTPPTPPPTSSGNEGQGGASQGSDPSSSGTSKNR